MAPWKNCFLFSGPGWKDSQEWLLVLLTFVLNDDDDNHSCHLLSARHCAKGFTRNVFKECVIGSSQLYAAATVATITPVSERTNQRFQVVKWLGQGHTVSDEGDLEFELSSFWKIKGSLILKRLLGTISWVGNMNLRVLLKCYPSVLFQWPGWPPPLHSSPHIVMLIFPVSLPTQWALREERLPVYTSLCWRSPIIHLANICWVVNVG